MSVLSAPLERLCQRVPGALAASIMGLDGLPVDTHTASKGDIDLSSLLVEYSSTLAQVRESAQMFAAGALEEISIRAENLTTIIRPITTEYFLALALLPEANFGKGRYHLRMTAPELVDELS
ncbi:MAG: roadblock/LC7 domain-containing protein [Deltaproteobacteria bacterium]|nr:roadblock/LC7 domain-containing protein [Deltaproteobacteria bacterium]